ncbi:DNA-(apurinic or apyrimidinic site) lyase 2, partial [Biomphalaria pfeifferi]
FPNNTQKEVAIINVYAPFIEKKNLKDRDEYRKNFLEDLQKKCIELRDLNFVHGELDLADNIQLNQDLYPRKWLSKMLESPEFDSALKPKKSLTAGFFIDAFRRKNPAAKKFTAKNDSKTEFTQRLDYILVDVDLFDYVIECDIIDDSRGSDHRPVFLKINCKPIELDLEEETSSQPKITASFKPSTSYAKESCNRKRKNEEENKESKKLKRKR